MYEIHGSVNITGKKWISEQQDECMGAGAANGEIDMKICYTCKHFLNLEPGSCRADVWYNHRCKAGSHGVKWQNPVTGNFDVDELPYCRDINDGDCKLFVHDRIKARYNTDLRDTLD